VTRLPAAAVTLGSHLFGCPDRPAGKLPPGTVTVMGATSAVGRICKGIEHPSTDRLLDRLNFKIERTVGHIDDRRVLVELTNGRIDVRIVKTVCSCRASATCMKSRAKLASPMTTLMVYEAVRDIHLETSERPKHRSGRTDRSRNRASEPPRSKTADRQCIQPSIADVRPHTMRSGRPRCSRQRWAEVEGVCVGLVAVLKSNNRELGSGHTSRNP